MSFGQRKLDREKPEIDFPEGDAPTELVIQDLIEGKGAEVVPGSRVLAHYVGVAFSTGEEPRRAASVPGWRGAGYPRLG